MRENLQCPNLRKEHTIHNQTPESTTEWAKENFDAGMMEYTYSRSNSGRSSQTNGLTKKRMHAWIKEWKDARQPKNHNDKWNDHDSSEASTEDIHAHKHNKYEQSNQNPSETHVTHACSRCKIMSFRSCLCSFTLCFPSGTAMSSNRETLLVLVLT